MKKVVLNILFIVYVIIAIFVTICLLSYNDFKVTELGDYSLVIIDDKELSPEYEKGDLVIVNKDKEIQPLPWGKWVKGLENLVVEHKGNYYLRITSTNPNDLEKASDVIATRYIQNGVETPLNSDALAYFETLKTTYSIET